VGGRGWRRRRPLARMPQSLTAAFALIARHLAPGKAFVEHLATYHLCIGALGPSAARPACQQADGGYENGNAADQKQRINPRRCVRKHPILHHLSLRDGGSLLRPSSSCPRVPHEPSVLCGQAAPDTTGSLSTGPKMAPPTSRASTMLSRTPSARGEREDSQASRWSSEQKNTIEGQHEAAAQPAKAKSYQTTPSGGD